MRKVSILNVKRYLEFVQEWTNYIMSRDGKHENGTTLAPIDKDALREMEFFARAILRKHAMKKSRKDIRIGER
jgi:hypothetical protein